MQGSGWPPSPRDPDDAVKTFGITVDRLMLMGLLAIVSIFAQRVFTQLDQTSVTASESLIKIRETQGDVAGLKVQVARVDQKLEKLEDSVNIARGIAGVAEVKAQNMEQKVNALEARVQQRDQTGQRIEEFIRNQWQKR